MDDRAVTELARALGLAPPADARSLARGVEDQLAATELLWAVDVGDVEALIEVEGAAGRRRSDGGGR